MRILHLITGLETGGAETALWRVVATQGDSVENRVVSMMEPGFVGQQMVAQGLNVSHLDMRRGMPSPVALCKLVSRLRSFRPHVVQTWLYHADLLGLMAARLADGLGPRTPVAWNLRCSYMDFASYPRTTAWTVALCARLSRSPAVVVANSSQAADHHGTLGYRPRRMEVIENGIDCERFAPDPEAALRLRRELELPEDAVLTGLAARFDPMKGVPVLLDALSETPGVHLVLCGQGMVPQNVLLAGLARTRNVVDRVHFLGYRPDIPQVLAGLDFAVSASLGESFPNVVAEAMSCGVPAVVTDVGASARLVGKTGRVVVPGDPGALAEGMRSMATLSRSSRAELGAQARERIARKWSLEACAEQYRELWQGLIKA